MTLARMAAILTDVDDIVAHVDARRAESEGEKSYAELNDLLDIGYLTSGNKRREEQQVLEPLVNTERPEISDGFDALPRKDLIDGRVLGGPSGNPRRGMDDGRPPCGLPDRIVG